jgi:phosphoserine aminotransferase
VPLDPLKHATRDVPGVGRRRVEHRTVCRHRLPVENGRHVRACTTEQVFANDHDDETRWSDVLLRAGVDDTEAADGSMLNTPATYSWYVAGRVFQWIKRHGGLAAMERLNRAKADMLYGAIDGSGYYANPVEKSCRSWMNVPFTLPNADLDKPFLEGAKKVGLVALEGHRSVGGMRASLYNAMPLAGVQKLVEYMSEFQRMHG